MSYKSTNSVLFSHAPFIITLRPFYAPAPHPLTCSALALTFSGLSLFIPHGDTGLETWRARSPFRTWARYLLECGLLLTWSLLVRRALFLANTMYAPRSTGGGSSVKIHTTLRG